MKVVVGYDGSEAGKRALERAAGLMSEGDRVVVVSAAEPHARPFIDSQGALLDSSEVDKRRHDLDEAKAFFAERGIEVEPMAGQGDPGNVIVAAAKDADLVVVGSRGLNPLQRLMLGSVSSKVVHRSPTDVLVVR